MVQINCILILALVLKLLIGLYHVLLIEPHDGSRLVLFTHHFNGFLSAIQIKSVVLLLLLNLHVLQAILLILLPLISKLGRHGPRRLHLIPHARQMEFAFPRRSIRVNPPLVILNINVSNIVLH